MIRVGVFGAGGRMGSTVCRAVSEEPGMELVAAVDPVHAGTRKSVAVRLAAEAHQLEVAGAQVAVDFTVLDAARENLRWCAEHDVHAIVGTTGFSDAELEEFAELFDRSSANAAIVPNFADRRGAHDAVRRDGGAILRDRGDHRAAPRHQDRRTVGHRRVDSAPLAAASKDWADDPTTTVLAEGARGGLVDGIAVHSVRMRGMVAHQEVLLGTTGQTLSIRHDSLRPSVVHARCAARDPQDRRDPGADDRSRRVPRPVNMLGSHSDRV